MSYQWIIDNAESITVVSKAVVARTQSRDGTVRQVARGGAVWQFEVTLASGMPWDTSRKYLEVVETQYNRSINDSIGLYTTGQASWLSKYQGNSANYTGFQASWTQGDDSITLTSSPSTASGSYKFRAGDLIQLGSTGFVYKVYGDVPHNSNTVDLNRPILDATGSGTLQVGPNVRWNVYCTQIPNLNFVGRNQIGFTSSYIFTEKLE
jgi:hypothetical protein